MLSAAIERTLAYGAPISRLTLPLINGLARRRLLRTGVEQREARLDGILVNYYYKAPAQPARCRPMRICAGIADNALTWSFMLGALARQYPVYALDVPATASQACRPRGPI